jgi:signal transduction histidine kinase
MRNDWGRHVRRRPRPPWWPENEPFPPRFGPGAWRHRRTRFERRFIAMMWLCIVLMFAGFNTLVSWLLPGVHIIGPSFGSLRPVFALFWLFIIFAFVIPAFRRFGSPLGEIVEAADRVAEGDYSARASEYGPRWMRTIARAFNSMTSKLQAQDQQRRHLMADVAHELRTPLAVLQGRLEGMLDGVYPRDEAQINAVLQETRMLTRLVDDLRTLAHSESGTLALQKESTDFGVLINDAVASFSADAAERRITLDVRAAPDLPLIEVDPLRIREVLTNLISNALRHTPEGGRVAVSASANPDSIVVSVSDTGSGIVASELPKIFDRFYKGRASRGSGLGLTIARNLVVAHGGEIHADSVEGKGTTVTVTLPLQLPRPPQ